MFPRFSPAIQITAEMLASDDLFLYQIQKDEAARSDFVRIDSLFKELKKAGNNAFCKVCIAFDYDDDPRELCEIPEVVSYIKGMFDLCPHLVYFLLPDQATLRTYIFCLADAKIKSRSEGMAHMDVDKNKFLAKIQEIERNTKAYATSIGDLPRTNTLFRELGF